MTLIDLHLPGVLKTDLTKLPKNEHVPPSLKTELLLWFQFWSMSDANLVHCFHMAKCTKNEAIVRLYLDVLAKRGYGVKLWHDEGRMFIKLFFENEDRLIEEIECHDEEEWQMFLDPPEPRFRVPDSQKSGSVRAFALHKALLPLGSSASKVPGVRMDIVVDKTVGPLGWWQKNPYQHTEGRNVYVTDSVYVTIEDIEESPNGDRFLHVRQTDHKDEYPWQQLITERDPVEE